jgi:Asp-tRNA(Asn)/Glu-tRNA(Gln) amidotransferase A subunit family amidase
MPGADEKISLEDLAAAERVAGIEFTPDERKLVLEGLPLALALYRRRRSTELPPELPPALGFDPRLPGTEPEGEQRPLVRSAREPGSPPEDDEELAFASIAELSRWLERGELSSQRLTRIALDRLRAFGPELECLVTLTEERALEQAERADREIAQGRTRGPLHGIPWGAKDLLDTRGAATTWGATPFRHRVPERDAEVVRLLEEAGAVLVAKLSLGELAQGAVWFGGRTRNPWKPDEGSGGSSAGSAAAVAAGLVTFSLGSETLGSITQPSMVCGVTGLRPTHGRVPRTGCMPLAWSLDKVGPLCRRVEDAAFVLSAIHGAHEGDPDSRDLPFNFDAGAGARGMRAGYVPSWFEDPWATPSERHALRTLEAIGVELVELTLPDLPYESLIVILQVEAAAAFEELTLSGRDDELQQQGAESWPNVFRVARMVPAVEYLQMQRLRRRVMEVAQDLLSRVDVLVAPGMGGTLSFLTNASGHPSLTLRAGLRENGTPTALTLHGRLFGEGRLCELGVALEAELDVWRERPAPTRRG